MVSAYSRRRGASIGPIVIVTLIGIYTQNVVAQLKFAALGNFGFDQYGQRTVAETLKHSAKSERISFIVSPGSNFPGGVSSANDTTWQDSFEDVYADADSTLKMPFFSVLGAEDWSGDYGAMKEHTDLVYENSAVAPTSPKWTLPNWWYTHLTYFAANTGSSFISTGHKDLSLGIIFVDTWILSTSFPFSNITNKAWDDLEKTLEIAPRILDYIIVVGDRPIYSSGSSKGDSNLQYYLEPLLKKAGVDAYISGYDFDLEVIEEDGLSHINCGSGSVGAGSSLVKASNSKYFSGDIGFCLFELNGDGLVVKLVNGESGESLYTHNQPIKRRPERSTIDQFSYVNELPEVKYWPVPPMGKMPGKDVFVRVVGTIGLCIFTLLASLTVASGISKAVK